MVGEEGGRGRVILALQATAPVHLGVDNLNVVRHVSHILSGASRGRPLHLCTDGDFLSKLLTSFVRGIRTTQVPKVKGHADDCTVRDGRVRALDKAGNDLADRAADFGRNRLPTGIIDARRLCTAAWRERYPIVFDLHQFFIAIARAVVNEDGHHGFAPHPTVWDRSKPKRRRVLQAVGEFASCQARLIFGDMARSVGLLSMLMLLRLLLGLVQPGSWLSCAPLLVACTGLLL